MAGLVMRWIGNSLAIWFVAWLFEDVILTTTQDAFIAGAVLGLVNTIVRPILVILTLPVTIVTLGIFYFVISAFCLWLTSYLLPGFEVHGFLVTLVSAILIGIVSAVITNALQGETRKERS